jgi:hypothetical protein
MIPFDDFHTCTLMLSKDSLGINMSTSIEEGEQVGLEVGYHCSTNLFPVPEMLDALRASLNEVFQVIRNYHEAVVKENNELLEDEDND